MIYLRLLNIHIFRWIQSLYDSQSDNHLEENYLFANNPIYSIPIHIIPVFCTTTPRLQGRFASGSLSFSCKMVSLSKPPHPAHNPLLPPADSPRSSHRDSCPIPSNPTSSCTVTYLLNAINCIHQAVDDLLPPHWSLQAANTDLLFLAPLKVHTRVTPRPTLNCYFGH